MSDPLIDRQRPAGLPIGNIDLQQQAVDEVLNERIKAAVKSGTNKLTGGRVNYYLVDVTHPQRETQPAYQAECEDIIEALRLNPDEANIFKEIWRSANARLNNGKQGHSALYGAEKIVHYAGRILRRLKREAESATSTRSPA